MEQNKESSGPTKKCPKCSEPIPADAKKCKHCQSDIRNWFARHKVITGFLILIVILIIASSSGNKSQKLDSAAKNVPQSSDQTTSAESSDSSANADQKASVPATRQVKGTATTLGAGNFIGGKDVPAGLYDVTAPKGQSGNFIVSGTDSYNDILGVAYGQGVPKVRAQISDGDKIQISSLSKVTFTPVSTPFVTTNTPVTLYAGTFTVGQDIAAGRYVASTTTGSSGNFIVSGINSVNEILGTSSGMGVPSVTTNLTDGDVITISSLSEVTMTPAN